MIEMINEKLENLDGNYISKNSGNIYISSSNMKKLIEYIRDDKSIFSALITPYLINEEKGTLYELHYYEQYIEIIDEGSSNCVNYNINNSLPKEITDNFYPRINVNKKDIGFLIKYLNHYFIKMDTLEFKDDRDSNVDLIDAKLYYQIF